MKWFAKIEHAVATNPLLVYLRGKQYQLSQRHDMLSQIGAISLKAIVGTVVAVVILGTAIPVLWPLIADSDTDIQAMNGTDDGTAFIQTFWPIAILIGGIGLAVGVVYLIMKKFRVG